MSQRAKVGSLEAIEAFRSQLIVYVARARSAVEEVSGDVLRTRIWLETDQKRFWEQEMRRRTRALEEAQQALFSARLSKFSTGMALEQLEMHRARRAVEESDVKLRTVKRWDRDFEGTVQPLVKQMEKLHTILTNDLTKAIAELGQTIRTLSDYSQTGAPPPSGAQAAASSGSEAQAAESPPPSGSKETP